MSDQALPSYLLAATAARRAGNVSRNGVQNPASGKPRLGPPCRCNSPTAPTATSASSPRPVRAPTSRACAPSPAVSQSSARMAVSVRSGARTCAPAARSPKSANSRARRSVAVCCSTNGRLGSKGGQRSATARRVGRPVILPDIRCPAFSGRYNGVGRPDRLSASAAKPVLRAMGLGSNSSGARSAARPGCALAAAATVSTAVATSAASRMTRSGTGAGIVGAGRKGKASSDKSQGRLGASHERGRPVPGVRAASARQSGVTHAGQRRSSAAAIGPFAALCRVRIVRPGTTTRASTPASKAQRTPARGHGDRQRGTVARLATITAPTIARSPPRLVSGS